METYDKIILGAGIYGLYSALFCAGRGQRILVLECDSAAFGRATYINQARVHQGYHYPRSLSTAMKSAGYFARFNADYDFCVNRSFRQIYATSAQYSWSDGEQFKRFCENARIPCEELHPEQFFQKDMCSGAFLTREYTYDAQILKAYFLEELAKHPQNVEIRCDTKINGICRDGDMYRLSTENGKEYRTGYLLNATYAGTNQILDLLGYEKFKIKYELCEIILCDVNAPLKDVGLTVMDGPFFSIMPFGKTGQHSLTSVTFTPHATSYEEVPTFACQERSGGHCSPFRLGSCNSCPARPQTAWPYMAKLARKYMRRDHTFSYRGSLFSMKPILVSSEIDDSRPTVIRTYSTNPTMVSVLSGKINTVFDLDEVLIDG